MSQVVGHVVAPLSVDCQLGVGLDKKRPTIRKFRMVEPHEALEAFRGLEQVNMDRLIRTRQSEPAAEFGPLRRQFLEQAMMGRKGEIAMNDQLVADQSIAV